jgi:hypothetical protein
MHLISWIEIPVRNIDRAIKFYETVLQIKLIREDIDNQYKYAYFESEDGGLIQGPEYEPAKKGVLVYFETEPDALDAILDRISLAGGTVLVPKTDTGEDSFYAQFMDTEGNKLGLRAELD